MTLTPLLIAEIALAILLAMMILYSRYRLRNAKSQITTLEGENARLQGTFGHLHHTNIEKEKEILEAVERTKKLYLIEINGLKTQLESEQKGRFSAEEGLAKERASWIVKVEEEKRDAYDRGVKDGTKDFSIMCESFVKMKKTWLGSKSYRAGYRYQLLVKGLPALDSKDIYVKEVDDVDDNVRDLVIGTAKTALSVLAKAQNIPLYFSPNQMKIEKE